MSGNALSFLLSSPKVKFVNELTGLYVWTGLKILSVEFCAPSENTDSPIYTADETAQDQDTAAAGVLARDLQDIKIHSAPVMKVTAFSNDTLLNTNLIRNFNNTMVTYSIFSKSVFAYNMALTEIEMEMSPEMLNAVKFQLTFERTDTNFTGTFNPLQGADSSLFGGGLQALKQQADNVIGTITSAGTQVRNLAQNVINRIG